MRLTTHLELVPRLRISAAIPPVPYKPSWRVQEQLYLLRAYLLNTGVSLKLTAKPMEVMSKSASFYACFLLKKTPSFENMSSQFRVPLSIFLSTTNSVSETHRYGTRQCHNGPCPRPRPSMQLNQIAAEVVQWHSSRQKQGEMCTVRMYYEQAT